jgi:hypothetical protein
MLGFPENLSIKGVADDVVIIAAARRDNPADGRRLPQDPWKTPVRPA